MGAPPKPTAEQAAALVKASSVVPSDALANPDGTFTVEMPPNSAVLLALS